MSCCGEKRAALKARLQAQSDAKSLAAPTRRLCYRSGISVAVPGPVTGRPYVFGAHRAPTEVDALDALALLETGRYEALD